MRLLPLIIGPGLALLLLAASAKGGSLRTRDGKNYQGQISIEDGAWVVRPATGGAVRVDLQNLGGALMVDPDTSPHGLKANYFGALGFQSLRGTRIDPQINLQLEGICPMPGVGPENYSVRWTGLIEARYTEEYTFRALADDGFRMMIDNRLVINDWTTGHGPLVSEGKIQLEAGKKYRIVAEFFNATGVSLAQLFWSSPSQPTELVPARFLYPAPIVPADSAIGLRGEYFTDAKLKEKKLTRIDSTIDFDWGEGAPDPAIPVDYFSIRWTGKIIPKYFERYNFIVAVDSGVRLWVNGKLIIDDWNVQGAHERKAERVPLAAGQAYDIKLEYFEATEQASVKLYWESQSQPREIVPTTSLVPEVDANAPTTAEAAGGRNWAEPELNTGLILRDGSVLAGTLAGFDEKTITLARQPRPAQLGQMLPPIPKPFRVLRADVAVVVYATPSDEQLRKLLSAGPGALQITGDFIDGDVIGLNVDHADVSSVVFGPTKLERPRLVAAVLHPIARTGACEVRTADGSRLVLPSARAIKIDGGQLRIEHPTLGSLALAQDELYEVTVSR